MNILEIKNSIKKVRRIIHHIDFTVKFYQTEKFMWIFKVKKSISMKNIRTAYSIYIFDYPVLDFIFLVDVVLELPQSKIPQVIWDQARGRYNSFIVFLGMKLLFRQIKPDTLHTLKK